MNERKGPLPTPAVSRAGAHSAAEPISKVRPDAEEILRVVLARLDDMKAEDTVTIDLTGKSTIADAMVVTSGRSNRHVGSVADRVLAERYRKRAADAGRSAGLSAVDIVEIKESRADEAARRMLEESIAVANLIPEGAISVILDAGGESMSSAAFAGRLRDWRGENKPAAVFIIGAADGLAPSLKE